MAFLFAGVCISAVWIGVADAGEAVDFAQQAQMDAWLRHPVLGEPSFDAFERTAGNPVVRGAAPYEWPVNGSLFRDPVSGNWYLYVGHYCEGYKIVPEARSMCTVSRSKDGAPLTFTVSVPGRHYAHNAVAALDRRGVQRWRTSNGDRESERLREWVNGESANERISARCHSPLLPTPHP